MSAIKGVGSAAIEQIVEERNDKGTFRSIFDFSSRIDTRVCNKKTVESLAQAGAFDTMHENRAQLLASIEDVLSYASRKQEEERLNQASLFGGGTGEGSLLSEPKLRECPPWTNIERLNKERELIGFYLSGHPLDKHKEDARIFATHTLSEDELNSLKGQETLKVIGIFTNVNRVTDRKGRPMAFAQIEDLHGSTEILIFSDVYDRHQGMIAPDTVVLLEGKASIRRGERSIIANSMDRVENLREKHQSKLQLTLLLQTGTLSGEEIKQVADLLSEHKGETPVKLVVQSAHAQSPIRMNVRKFVVEPGNTLLAGLKEVIGSNAVKLSKNNGSPL
jgi:DNA polymerase-3 subunit alpha